MNRTKNSKLSKDDKSSAASSQDDLDLFTGTPEVTAFSRNISEIVDLQHKTRDQQIEDLQALIDLQSQQLKIAEEALEASKASKNDTKRPLSDTPSPNQNTPSPERPQDIAFKQVLELQAATEPKLASTPPTDDQKQFIQFIGDVVKAITKKDTSEVDSPLSWLDTTHDEAHLSKVFIAGPNVFW
jgi:hypothetical protein